LSRDRVFHLLDAKGYSAEQIAVYIKLSITSGKTRMTLTDYYSKDLMDVPGIDLDAAARLPWRM
jgi:hypothetical protein